MKTIKLIAFCLIITIATAIGWVIGGTIGNVLTSSTPPAPANNSHAGGMFLAVCAFNSILIAMLLILTRSYSGINKRISLIVYVFGVQFFLTQIETFFFAEGIGIGHAQTIAIVIAGALSSTTTMLLSMYVYGKLFGKNSETIPLKLSLRYPKQVFVPLVFIIVIGYPFLYLTFGYYVAWQSENLRIFYTSSSAMDPFLPQTAKAFSNGIYPMQIVRGLIWVVVTIPVVVMLQGNALRQFAVVAILTSLLPTSLLFIPNPYMPGDISMTHFIETSTSNFLWGLLMVWMIKKGLNV